jgi:hypothetical protein
MKKQDQSSLRCGDVWIVLFGILANDAISLKQQDFY